jgi:hypothetical protein
MDGMAGIRESFGGQEVAENERSPNEETRERSGSLTLAETIGRSQRSSSVEPLRT